MIKTKSKYYVLLTSIMLIQCLHGILNGGIEGRKRSDKHFAHHFGGVIKIVAVL